MPRRPKVRHNLNFDRELDQFFWAVMQLLGHDVALKGKGELLSQLMLDKLEELAETYPDPDIRSYIKRWLSNFSDTTNIYNVKGSQD